jgi:polysaccharide deacetylase 2 family uncharacterized protein YibQ
MADGSVNRAVRAGMFALLGFALMGSTPAADLPPRLALVIDDLGYQPALDQVVLNLDSRVAVAVIPDGPGAGAVALRAARQNREILIHLPLAHVGTDDCETATCPQGQWSAERMRRHLEWADTRVPGAVGLSNHQGSRFTADAAATRRLVEGLVLLNRQRQPPLFVIDSRTTPASHLAREASRAGLASAQRRVFLDHERSAEAIAAAWSRLIEHALAEGRAIAIGHPYPETLAFLARAIPALEQTGVRLVPLSSLLDRPVQAVLVPGQAAALAAYPPAPE